MAKRARTFKTTKPPLKRAKTMVRAPVFSKVHLQGELKDFTFARTVGNIVAAQSTGVIFSIFSPDQGTGPSEHVGRSTKASQLLYKFAFNYAATTAGGGSAIRVVIVYDAQPNAAITSVTTIMESDNIAAFPNLSNKKRFKILVDDVCEIGVSTQGGTCNMMTGFRKISLETNYNDVNGGTIADITTGSYLAIIWQTGGITIANPTSFWNSRIRYVDN